MNGLDKPTESSGSLKKTYSKPELQVYGNLKDITQSLGVTGAMDGGVVLAKTSL
jgi:hypothetical protein